MLTSGGSQPSISYKYETMFNLDNVAIGIVCLKKKIKLRMKKS